MAADVTSSCSTVSRFTTDCMNKALLWAAICLIVLGVFGVIYGMLAVNATHVEFRTNNVHHVIEAKDCVILIKEHTVRVECKL